MSIVQCTRPRRGGSTTPPPHHTTGTSRTSVGVLLQVTEASVEYNLSCSLVQPRSSPHRPQLGQLPSTSSLLDSRGVLHGSSERSSMKPRACKVVQGADRECHQPSHPDHRHGGAPSEKRPADPPREAYGGRMGTFVCNVHRTAIAYASRSRCSPFTPLEEGRSPHGNTATRPRTIHVQDTSQAGRLGICR
jgi:hypothetical protein